MLEVDPQQIAQMIIDNTRAHILPYYRNLRDEDVALKGMDKYKGADLVTIADTEMEAAMREALERLYPDSVMLGEEAEAAANKKGETTLGRLKEPGMTWIIDPVDGTGAFAEGGSGFTVILACVIDGETRCSWIYDPLTEDMAIAEKGGGATLNGNRINLGDSALEKSVATFSRGFSESMSAHFNRQNIGAIRMLVGVGYRYLEILQGNIQFGVFKQRKTWEHLAGSLLIRESGGRAEQWDGTSYDASSDPEGEGLIVASSPTLWQRAHKAYMEPFVPVKATKAPLPVFEC